jgi:hypothetical protein
VQKTFLCGHSEESMNEHALLLLWEGALGPALLLFLGGIVSVHVRLARLETKLEPLWRWWNEEQEKKISAR